MYNIDDAERQDFRFLEAISAENLDLVELYAANGKPVRDIRDAGLVAPTLPDGRVVFVVGDSLDPDAETFPQCKLSPAVVLYDDTAGVRRFGWRLDSPQSLTPALTNLARALGMDLAERIPLPGRQGWRLEHADAGASHCLEALLEAYGGDPEAAKASMPAAPKPQRVSMKDAAMDLAERGFRVFPVHEVKRGKAGGLECACEDRRRKAAKLEGELHTPCTEPGKHPRTRHGLKDASQDPEQIDRWWNNWTRANIGIATGSESGVWVLDVDGDQGRATLAALVAENGELPATVEAVTGSGGAHYLFKWPAGLDLKNTTSALGSNLDTRAVGGYFIAAPSRHVSGGVYTWAPGKSPFEITPVDAPGWLLDLAFRATKGREKAGPRPAKEAPRTPGARAPVAEGEGWARYLALIGDGDGLGGFHGPIYSAACSYFANEGADADADPLTAALIEAVTAAPVGPDRVNRESKYLDAGYLNESIEAARAFIQSQPAEPRSLNPAEVAAEVREIVAAIDGMDPHDSAAYAALCGRIALLPESEVEVLAPLLAKKRGMKKTTVVRNDIEARRPRRSGPSGGGNIQIDPVTGDRLLLHSGEAPDAVEALDFVLGGLIHDNANGPIWTSSLGHIMLMRRAGGRVTFDDISEGKFHSAFATRNKFVQIEDGVMRRRRLPTHDVTQVVFHTAADDPRIPPTPQIRRSPSFDADGRLLDRDGHFGAVFNDFGGLEVPPIPDEPSADDVRVALEKLAVGMLGDFEFRDRDGAGDITKTAGRANALAMLLTPFARDLFYGPAPAFGITKPNSGAGGTLLGRLSSLLADGRETAPTPHTANAEEMQKVLVSVARGGDSHVFFDNVEVFNSPILLGVLTSGVIGGRILGVSEMITRPNDRSFIYTGINPTVSAEMARRTCWIRLAKPTVTTFRHAQLDEWVLKNRGDLIASALTLIQAWVKAGSPAGSDEVARKSATFCSFVGWGEALGGILEHAGVKGFLIDRRLESADPKEVALQAFADAWCLTHKHGDQTEDQLFEWARGAFEELMPGRDDGERKTAFRDQLGRLQDRHFEVGVPAKTCEIERTATGWKLAVVNAEAVEEAR